MFVQFSEDVSETELQKILPRLNETKWYEKWNDTELLTFEFKKQRETELAGKFKTRIFI